MKTLRDQPATLQGAVAIATNEQNLTIQEVNNLNIYLGLLRLKAHNHMSGVGVVA